MLRFKRIIEQVLWCFTSSCKQTGVMLHLIVGNLWLKLTVLCATATRVSKEDNFDPVHQGKESSHTCSN